MATEIHVVSKKDLTKHKTVPASVSLPPLSASSIRARSSLVALTSNNLSYAKLGNHLHWWSAWPVPADASAPYNNKADWGIVPAWGFGRVLESNFDSIPSGSLLYGFWPTSSHPVDLTLETSDPETHFREVSDHRRELGSMYNRYSLVDEMVRPEDSWALFANAYSIWNAGYVLNRFCFPTEYKPAHPFGQHGGEWTDEDAELSAAVLVNLSASSRTGRSATWNFTRNRKPGVNGPLAFLSATSSPKALEPAPQAAFEVECVSYDDLAAGKTVEWIRKFKPKRIVVLDNGAPVAITEQFREVLKAALPEAQVSLVLIGVEPKMGTTDELVALLGSKRKSGGTVELDSTSVIDIGVATEGGDKFFEENEKAFNRAVEENYLGDMELVQGSGVSGSEGVQGGAGKLGFWVVEA
ncbi:hypothetical protein BDP55DRAFT_729595 [Colletotrichum godetiae]|uniref:Uncharacterized protein n=1 Tax=Colletotrichum godetiae TaxID=1209918 RepID=A0AAJ0AIL7_9PEZI|nr:uncharacterized protein BDP55DRAFT_729595 [Colletotrichum godetiae]KAK1674576.1 hypothetical protein BDP55DRAFT_729595 [Colletotrichum godetiae]